MNLLVELWIVTIHVLKSFLGSWCVTGAQHFFLTLGANSQQMADSEHIARLDANLSLDNFPFFKRTKCNLQMMLFLYVLSRGDGSNQ